MADRHPLASRSEVAAYLGLPVATLNRWGTEGAGPRYVRVGRHARYRWEDVEAWLEQQGPDPIGAAR